MPDRVNRLAPARTPERAFSCPEPWMPRYATRSDVYYMDEHQALDIGGITVHETDRSPLPTGLLNANGDELYRIPETVPFGFVRGVTVEKSPKRRKGRS